MLHNKGDRYHDRAGDLLRYMAALLSALLLAGCGSAPDSSRHIQPLAATMDAPLDFLLASAAADFRAHRPPYPTRFRDVRLGYMEAGGSRQYLVCGAFLPEGEAADVWIPFVTIRTSGYEQYLGDQATRFCERSSVVWVEGDLSEALRNRLDSIR